MPKRARRGDVSRPLRVVAPMSVKVVLHGRVEILFHYRAQAVDLVDEKHVVLLQRSQYAGQIARLVEHGARCHFEAHSEFVGHDGRQCSLAQAGRAVEQQMVESFAAHAGSRHEYLEIGHNAVLTGKCVEMRRAKSLLYIAVAVRCRLAGGAYVEIFFQIYWIMDFMRDNMSAGSIESRHR